MIRLSISEIENDPSKKWIFELGRLDSDLLHGSEYSRSFPPYFEDAVEEIAERHGYSVMSLNHMSGSTFYVFTKEGS